MREGRARARHPIALGNDVGCQWVAQYDFWRELCYFHKYAGASNACALYCATGRVRGWRGSAM